MGMSLQIGLEMVRMLQAWRGIKDVCMKGGDLPMVDGSIAALDEDLVRVVIGVVRVVV